MSIELLSVIITSALTLITSVTTLHLSRKWRKKDQTFITKEVEEIKSEFLRKQASYQAKIELALSSKKENRNDLKKGIIEFWESHFELLRLCDTTRYEIDELRMNEFLALKKRIESQEENCEISFTRLYFFTENEALIDLVNKINIQATKNAIKFLRFLDSLEPYLEKAKQSLQNNSDNNYQDHIKKMDELILDMDKYLDAHDLIPLLDDFKNLSKSHQIGIFQNKGQ